MMENTAISKERESISQSVGSRAAQILQWMLRPFRLALRTSAGRIGLPLVMLFVVLALVGPWLAPYSPTQFHLDHVLEAPSGQFWFGTDQYGRDILSRVMAGAQSIILISTAGALLGIVLGTLVGMGKGGKTDEVVMRIMDGLMSFPSLLMALLVLTSLSANAVNVILTIGIVFIAPVSRVMRSVTLSLKTLEFVQSARLRGEPQWYIIFREMLPNAFPTLIVEASIRLSYAILLASSLGFLGLGVQPPSPDWGLMLSESRKFIADSPWAVLFPAAAIALLVIGVNLLTDGIKQARLLPKRGAKQ